MYGITRHNPKPSSAMRLEMIFEEDSVCLFRLKVVSRSLLAIAGAKFRRLHFTVLLADGRSVAQASGWRSSGPFGSRTSWGKPQELPTTVYLSRWLSLSVLIVSSSS